MMIKFKCNCCMSMHPLSKRQLGPCASLWKDPRITMSPLALWRARFQPHVLLQSLAFRYFLRVVPVSRAACLTLSKTTIHLGKRQPHHHPPRWPLCDCHRFWTLMLLSFPSDDHDHYYHHYQQQQRHHSRALWKCPERK